MAVLRSGLACPLGLRSDSALAAIGAGTLRFTIPEEAPEGRVCRLSLVPGSTSRTERMRTLLGHAVAEALQPPFEHAVGVIPFVVSLPAPQSGGSVDEEAVLGELRARAAAAGVPVDEALSSVVREGRSGIFRAFERAHALLSSGQCAAVLVAAVDSLVDAESLAQLDDDGLLLDQRNLDGRIPGEAASVLLLAKASAAGSAVLGHVRGLATERDSGSFRDVRSGKVVSRGDGLARAFRGLRSAFTGRAELVVSGQTCESYWARELSCAYLRNEPLMPEPFTPVATGMELGDTGAASGGVALCRALGELSPRPWRRRHRRRNALVYDVSDDGQVGGLALFEGDGKAWVSSE